MTTAFRRATVAAPIRSGRGEPSRRIVGVTGYAPRQAVEGGRPGWDEAEGARAVGRAQRRGHRDGLARGGPRPEGRGRAVKLAALAALIVPLTTGCSVDEVLRFGWPVGVTPQAENMRTLWTWSVVAALVVGLHHLGRDVLGDDLPPEARRRRRRAAAPDPVQPARRDRLHRHPDDHRGGAVRVHRAGAEQRERPGRRRRTSRSTSSRSSGTGSSPTRTRARRRVPPVTTIGTSDTIPLLVLPTDRTIQFTQRSNDVIHSF